MFVHACRGRVKGAHSLCLLPAHAANSHVFQFNVECRTKYFFCIIDKVKYDINIISDNMAAADSMFVKNEESGGDEENILVFPTFSQVEEVKEEVIR